MINLDLMHDTEEKSVVVWRPGDPQPFSQPANRCIHKIECGAASGIIRITTGTEHCAYPCREVINFPLPLTVAADDVFALLHAPDREDESPTFTLHYTEEEA